jgi:hypothetical protein
MVDRPARGTPLAGVFEVDEQHRDAGASGFVLDECPQLPEPAVTKPGALGTAGLDPFADALEGFKADAATEALRRQHDSLREAVVLVPLEPALFARERAKLACGGLGAATLESGPRRAGRCTFSTFSPVWCVPSLSVARLTMPRSTPRTLVALISSGAAMSQMRARDPLPRINIRSTSPLR